MKKNPGFFLCGICIAVILNGCGPGDAGTQPKAPPPVPVNVDTVRTGSARYFDTYPGTVTAVNQVDVRPQVSGYITGIYFKEGGHVNKGEKLYSIDPQLYRGAYEQAQANLHVAESNMAKAQQDADRYAELNKHDAIAKQTLDHALSDLETSKRQVEAAKANMSSVETNLRYSTIYAPFSGTIGISLVKMGASVSPGQTILNTISSDDPLAVDFVLNESQIPAFIKIQQTDKKATDSTFTLVLADKSKYPFPGKIYFIDRAVDPQTGTIKTRLEFPNPQKLLRVGMTCNVRVVNNSSAQGILIPYKAVVEQMGEYFVFTVKENKVTQKKIAIGAMINDKIVVRDGLKAGEILVIDGIQKLRDGSSVQIGAKKPSAPTDSTRAK